MNNTVYTTVYKYYCTMELLQRNINYKGKKKSMNPP